MQKKPLVGLKMKRYHNEQIRTIDKSRLKEKIGHITDIEVMNQVNNAIGISFGLEEL